MHGHLTVHNEKMSKSIGEQKKGHSIGLLDDEKDIKKAIMSSVTDSGMETRFGHAGAGVINLMTLYQVMTGETREKIEAQFEGKGYGTLKKALLEATLEKLRPVRAKYEELTADPHHIDAILKDGANRIRPIAERTMQRVKQAVGLG